MQRCVNETPFSSSSLDPTSLHSCLASRGTSQSVLGLVLVRTAATMPTLGLDRPRRTRGHFESVYTVHVCWGGREPGSLSVCVE